MIMSKEKLIKSIREIPDFPIPGILFYDVTTRFGTSSGTFGYYVRNVQG